jgi:hypothetical protein
LRPRDRFASVPRMKSPSLLVLLCLAAAACDKPEVAADKPAPSAVATAVSSASSPPPAVSSAPAATVPAPSAGAGAAPTKDAVVSVFDPAKEPARTVKALAGGSVALYLPEWTGTT